MRRVNVRLDGNAPRRWHLRLIERLVARGDCVVAVDARPGPGGLPANATMLFSLETTVHGLVRPGPSSRIGRDALAGHEPAFPDPDLVIDLCGDAGEALPRIWTLAFDGIAGEQSLLMSILGGRAPIATVVERNEVVAIARLGTEYRGIALATFDDALARCITLLLAALDGGARSLPASQEDPAVPATLDRLAMKRLARKAVTMLAGKIASRLYHLCYHAPHWRVGWRKLSDRDLVGLRNHPGAGWHDIPDDGLRFYADPFPIAFRGSVTLFVEDYIHATGKAVISAVRFGPGGPVGKPVPVLELGHHLSYPFVFEAEGSVWMVPEACTSGRIDLYRSTDFPAGWRHEATLVSDVSANDATLHFDGHRWWLFATVRDEAGAFSDALHLWSALDFRGPWTAHPKNPVLIDIASARPAGRLIEQDGALFRPVQDCRKGYGAALGLARVVRLDDDGFEQTLETVLRAGREWPGRRLHSLTSAGGLAFIDGSAWARRKLLPRPSP